MAGFLENELESVRRQARSESEHNGDHRQGKTPLHEVEHGLNNPLRGEDFPMVVNALFGLQ